MQRRTPGFHDDDERTPASAVRIAHVALWTHDIERLRDFYARYFGAQFGTRYESSTQAGFVSYFLTFGSTDSRLEIMTAPGLQHGAPGSVAGYAHIAISVGSREAVDALASRMRDDGVRVRSGPRQTGDGYYESVVEDTDGNLIEITI